jgi:hypothetical protein
LTHHSINNSDISTTPTRELLQVLIPDKKIPALNKPGFLVLASAKVYFHGLMIFHASSMHPGKVQPD